MQKSDVVEEKKMSGEIGLFEETHTNEQFKKLTVSIANDKRRTNKYPLKRN